MRSKLVEAFYHWLKLRLPDQVYEGLVPNNPQLLEIVFKELENNSDENMENATNCVIELIHVAGKKSQFAAIKDAVMANVSLLVSKVDMAVANNDEEIAEQLINIFVELGQEHVEQIIETNTLTIPQILLKLLQIPNASKYIFC
jgi:hypothetical protein